MSRSAPRSSPSSERINLAEKFARGFEVLQGLLGVPGKERVAAESDVQPSDLDQLFGRWSAPEEHSEEAQGIKIKTQGGKR